jgi:DNA mismatch endonuclease (patch repair protein)
MQRTLQRDNPLEVAVRSALHRYGLRFRVHYRPVGGSRAESDIAFPRQRIAVLIDGCFWHGCPEHATRPKRNDAWWAEKLDANVERDRRNETVFTDAGWHVLRFWEHETVETIVRTVITAVRGAERGARPSRRVPPSF